MIQPLYYAFINLQRVKEGKKIHTNYKMDVQISATTNFETVYLVHKQICFLCLVLLHYVLPDHTTHQ